MRNMLDIETFSTEPNALVFEVAVMPFNRYGPGHGYERVWRFRPETGVMDPMTVFWWMKQERRPQLPEMDEATAVMEIFTWLEGHDNQELWAKPVSFDCVHLESLLRRHNLPMPVDFRLWRDVRTVCAQAGFPPLDEPIEGVEHDPHYDCRKQIAELLVAERTLRR